MPNEKHTHSPEAWKIASQFSDVLASETRDLAAMIDALRKEDAIKIILLERKVATLEGKYACGGCGGTGKKEGGECRYCKGEGYV